MRASRSHYESTETHFGYPTRLGGHPDHHRKLLSNSSPRCRNTDRDAGFDARYRWAAAPCCGGWIVARDTHRTQQAMPGVWVYAATSEHLEEFLQPMAFSFGRFCECRALNLFRFFAFCGFSFGRFCGRRPLGSRPRATCSMRSVRASLFRPNARRAHRESFPLDFYSPLDRQRNGVGAPAGGKIGGHLASRALVGCLS